MQNTITCIQTRTHTHTHPHLGMHIKKNEGPIFNKNQSVTMQNAHRYEVVRFEHIYNKD